MAPTDEQTAAPLEITTRGTSGTFQAQPDGSVKGTVVGLSATSTWTDEVTKKSGSAETAPTLDTLEVDQGADPMVIHVADAPQNQNQVVVFLSSISIDTASNTLSYAGQMNSAGNSTGDPTLDPFAADADPSLTSTFGPSTVIIADHDSNAIISDGQLKAAMRAAPLSSGWARG